MWVGMGRRGSVAVLTAKRSVCVTPEVKPLNVSHADDEGCKRDLLYDRWYQKSKTEEPVFPQKSLVFSKNLENK